jgi:uncharacterized heparinase superfamily protein
MKAPLPAPLALPSAATAALGRRMRREWRATPLHRLALALPRPVGLSVRPRDARPADAAAGARLLAGVFELAGERLDVGPQGDPWRRAPPSRRFAAALHGFAWLPDLMTQGEAGAREALRLWLEWRRAFGRYNDFAWSGLALERRVFHLACAAGELAPLVSDAEGAAYVDGLARQARHLIGAPDDPGRAAERAAVAALVGAALAGAPGEALRRRALARLSLRLAEAVLPDGVHASRAPERGLMLLFDLLALDDGLSQLGAPAPPEVSRAIDRLAAATRFFGLADGRLAAFQGGEPGRRSDVAAARALDRGGGEIPRTAPYGAYHRLEGGPLQLIVDAGAPAGGGFAGTACAQPGAVTVACEGRRLIAGSAWSAKAEVGGALRGPEGGSCLGLDGEWPSAALRRGLLAAGVPERLESGLAAVAAERHQNGGETWLDVAHDGWRGLACTRRLYVDAAAGELRGEDALTPTGSPRREAAAFTIRFILAPGAAAQVAVDGKSAMLRPAGARGWRLRSDAAETRLAPGALVEDGQGRATQVLTLHGVARPGEEARVRWKLTRDEG